MLELAQNAKYFICNWKDIKLRVSRGIENAVTAGIMIESRAFSDPSASPVCRSMALIS